MQEQITKSVYEKVILTDKKYVEGNFKQCKQSWDIIYYKETRGMIDKIVLRTFRELIGQEKKIDFKPISIYFKYPEQLKVLISELINGYIYFMVARNKPEVILSEYKKKVFNSIMVTLRDEQLERWREEI